MFVEHCIFSVVFLGTSKYQKLIFPQQLLINLICLFFQYSLSFLCLQTCFCFSAVAFMFLFGFIISLITLLFLLVGVISERAICEPLSNPDPEQFTVIRLLDDYNLDFGIDVKPSALLSNCFQNRSIYTTFNLQKRFNLDEIRAKFDISEAMKNLQFNSSIIPDDFTIIGDDTLDNLAKFNPDINSDGFIDEVKSRLLHFVYI